VCYPCCRLAGGPAVPQEASPYCTLCPVGTFSPGGNREQCSPCPFGTTSSPNSNSVTACVISPTSCPPGQIAPPTAVSVSECSCLPGFGWTGNTATGSCQICPVGSYGLPGAGLQPCFSCGFGSTSPEGASSSLDCYAVNQCPVGMWIPPGSISDPPSSAAECICKGGYGGVCLFRSAADDQLLIIWHVSRSNAALQFFKQQTK
jgi:hypothetical protein